MIRALVKLILLVIVIVAVGTFFLGWNLGGRRTTGVDEAREGGGTAGTTTAQKAREVGATLSERAGQAAEATERALSDGSLTAKIKAKMALDDRVKALNLDVDTSAGVVTVSGVAHSQAERERALQLARETDGVKQVIDRLTVK